MVKLEADRAEADPKVFTKINMHFTVTANGDLLTLVAKGCL